MCTACTRPQLYHGPCCDSILVHIHVARPLAHIIISSSSSNQSVFESPCIFLRVRKVLQLARVLPTSRQPGLGRSVDVTLIHYELAGRVRQCSSKQATCIEDHIACCKGQGRKVSLRLGQRLRTSAPSTATQRRSVGGGRGLVRANASCGLQHGRRERWCDRSPLAPRTTPAAGCHR